jgi:NAD(P)H-nitrite reductase large subunit
VIICQCRVVTDAAVVAAVEAGAGSLAAVCRETGAGTDCGGCVFTVKAIVCEHDVQRAQTMDDLWALTHDEETTRAAS